MSLKLDITEDSLIQQNFRTLHAGDDYDYGFTFQREDVDVDLTGATVWLTIKDDTNDTDANAKLQLISTDTDQIEIDDPTGGHFVVKFRGTGSKSTADLEGLWSYDIQVKESSGALTTIAYGSIQFLINITRTTT